MRTFFCFADIARRFHGLRIVCHLAGAATMFGMRVLVALLLCSRCAWGALVLSAGFSDSAVLQRSPTSGAAIYGFTDTPAAVTLVLASADPAGLTNKNIGTTRATPAAPVSVQCEVSKWTPSECGAGGDTKTPCPAPPHGSYTFRGVLPPHPDAGGNYTLTIQSATPGPNSTVVLHRLTYGDVWLCSV